MKSDAHSKRLQLWIDYLRTGKRGALPALPYHETLGKQDEKISGVVDERANLAIRPDTITKSMRMAFEQFGLPPSNPFAWRLLLYVFADVHFGPPITSAGRPKKWTAIRWCWLLSDFDQIQQRKPTASESAICGYLKSDREIGHRYANVSAATIRRNLQYARDPSFNESLKMLADIYEEDELGGRSTHSSVTENENETKKAIEKALNVISTAWKRSAKIRI